MDKDELIKLLMEALTLSNETFEIFHASNIVEGEAKSMLAKLISSNSKVMKMVEEEL